jgi:hypothetical protein
MRCGVVCGKILKGMEVNAEGSVACKNVEPETFSSYSMPSFLV